MRKVKLCGIGLPKIKWWKNLCLHTQSRQQRVKRFSQLPPTSHPFSPSFSLYVVTGQSAASSRCESHTHHSSSPLPEDHLSTLLPYSNTPVLPKPPDYIKCCLALAFSLPQLDPDPLPDKDAPQEPKEPWKPGTPLFRLLHILPTPLSYFSESNRHFPHSHLDPTAGLQNQNALARHVLYEVTPLPS